MNKKRPETERLIEFLANAPYGYQLTYKELSRVCQWDSDKDRHLLQTAIKNLADDGFQFRSIPGIGYVKLEPNSGVTEIRHHHNSQQMRSTQRFERKLHGVRIGSLSPEGREQFHRGIQEVHLRRAAEQQFFSDSVRVSVQGIREKLRKEREEAQRKQLQSAGEWAQQNNFG